jgi:hypothetical protein
MPESAFNIAHCVLYLLSTMIRTVVLVSMIYDLLLGAVLLAAPDAAARAFGVPQISPPIMANLTGWFALSAGFCYLLPLKDPVRWRSLLWILGPVLKGGGALLFLADYFLHHSPTVFLLVCAIDGALALWTWIVLRRSS